MAITPANQQQVARAAASSVTSLASTGVLGGVASSSGASVARLPSLSRQVALALGTARQSALSARVRTLDTASEQIDCPAGGSITLTLTYSNASQFTPGDTLGFTFNNCQTSATDRTNGAMSIAMSSYAETAVGESFAGTMSLNLTATEGDRTSAVSGSVSANYADLSATTSRLDLIVVGSSGLTASVTTAGGTPETIGYVSGFTISETDTSTSSSVTVNGSIDSSRLAGRITLQTATPIVQQAADAYPSSGVLRVTGAGGSALLLTAQSATALQVQLDANGDGTYEATATYTWAEVLPG
ncbi:MAG TPA: hypothetical protein VFO28_12110 [Burkholderiaceae bacterium]|nr:hypothetical protein [Burkholderiaceae bacterium]